MRIEGYKPSGFIFSSVTTVVTTVSSLSTAAAFFLQAQTSDLMYRVDGAAFGRATLNEGFLLKGTARDSTYWAHNNAVRNLQIAAGTSGSTVHAAVLLLDKE